MVWPRIRLDFRRRVAPGGSVALALALAACYGARPDACAAVTVFPAWAWVVPGVGLAALGLRRGGNRGVLLTLGCWLVFLLGFAEEPWSLLRLATSPAPASPDVAVRVVSLNCDIGNRAASAEVLALRPDIVLLQESPGSEEVRALARRLFGDEGGFIAGVDASLIARGEVVPAGLTLAERATSVQARVRLRPGVEVEVISARLVPAVFRLDLWSPDCWREQAENRRRRSAQVVALARRVAGVPEGVPVVLGGDLNAPQGDAAFWPLRPRLRDSFNEAGRGWGNTILNQLPVLRIDQVWVGGPIRALGVTARPTRNSDHRMVVCDLAVAKPPATPGGGHGK